MPMRAQTRKLGPDGLFWCVTSGGQLFTFDPKKEEIIDKGRNWPGAQTYACSMDRSPGGRYVYYLPGAHGHGQADFAGLRHHQPADSPRHVAWKSVARGGPWRTKQFAGAGSQSVWLDWQGLPTNLGLDARLSRLARDRKSVV